MNADKLHFLSSSQFEHYWDYDFEDGDPCGLYMVTFDSVTHEWFGLHRCSNDPDGDYDEGNPMTSPEIKQCIAAIPVLKLPTGYRSGDA